MDNGTDTCSCAYCHRILDNPTSLVLYDKSKGILFCNGPSGNEQIHHQVREIKSFSCHWQYLRSGHSINVMQASLSVAIKECDSYRQQQEVKQAELYQKSKVPLTPVESDSTGKSLVKRILELVGW